MRPPSRHTRSRRARRSGPSAAMAASASPPARSRRASSSPSHFSVRLAHASIRCMRATRSQWWSAAVVMWMVPRMGQDRTSRPASKAASTSARPARAVRETIAWDAEETCWPWTASWRRTASAGSGAAVAPTSPWATRRR